MLEQPLLELVERLEQVLLLAVPLVSHPLLVAPSRDDPADLTSTSRLSKALVWPRVQHLCHPLLRVRLGDLLDEDLSEPLLRSRSGILRCPPPPLLCRVVVLLSRVALVVYFYDPPCQDQRRHGPNTCHVSYHSLLAHHMHRGCRDLGLCLSFCHCHRRRTYGLGHRKYLVRHTHHLDGATGGLLGHHLYHRLDHYRHFVAAVEHVDLVCCPASTLLLNGMSLRNAC
mmetsp:Transcript_126355/g.200404  ORF Transcript_126355/g.200404 Transcript_126355/m.200404 type:complete len:227 (+) Transcript_126355:389-1069(+)